MEQFSRRLRERARELRLSDAEVARRAGLTERRYGHYVTGEREPNLKTLVKIARVLETTPNELLGFSEARQGAKMERLRARVRSACEALDPANLRVAAVQLGALLRHQREGDG